MKVLLTGGTGFIGSHVAVALAGQAHEVTILARNPEKVPALGQISGIRIVPGDITDRGLLDGLVQGQDACVHVALNYTKPTGWEVLLEDTLPTVYLAGASAAAGVRQFLYTSSTAVNDSLYAGGGDPPEERIRLATAATKQRPATFYGATKAASENYLIAQSYRSTMRVNIIRPGYTFGNPALPGGSTEGDARFRDIAGNAVRGLPIQVIHHDGTQFIPAGDLAQLYLAILNSEINRRTYYGLGWRFVTWQAVAEEAVRRSASRSEIVVEDRGWSEDSLSWDVSDMKTDFGLEFDAWDRIGKHLDFCISREQASL
jgi:UDP-glucose 4-epimerase